MSARTLGLAFLLAAITVEALAQAFLKRAAGHGSEGDTLLQSLARIVRRGWPLVAIGILFFIVDACFWTLALQRLPVSLAFPLQSLQIVAIALISACFLKESVGRRRWLGIALILAGTALVGA